MKLQSVQRWWVRDRRSRFLLVVFVLVVAAGAGYGLVRQSRAASYVASQEAEAGQLQGSAAIVDAAADSGRSVRFGNASPNPNPPGYTSPANPQLSQEGRNVLYYLQSIQGNHILAGQEEADRCTRCEMDRMRGITGKDPALHGHDVADYIIDPMDEAIADWNRRQLVTFSWHMGAPPGDDSSFDNTFKDVDVNRVLQSGTNENRIYMAKLDKMATRLQRLEDARVPVLWRPLHEMNGGWFWWSKSGAEPYRRLWIHQFNYFTQTKGLHNLIWVWSAAQTKLPESAWYPGDQYVDITGSDTYENFSNMGLWTDHYNRHKQIAPLKPSALTETDKMPNPDELKSRNNKMIWFLPWFGQYVDVNSADYKRQVYNHQYVLTADEMPDLKQPFPR